MKKAISIVLLLSVVFLGLASCEGDYLDPGALEMMGSGGGGFGDDGDHGGGGGYDDDDDNGGSGSGAKWPANLNGTEWSTNSGTLKFNTNGTFQFQTGPHDLVSAANNGKIVVKAWSENETLCKSYSISGNELTLKDCSNKLIGSTTITGTKKGGDDDGGSGSGSGLTATSAEFTGAKVRVNLSGNIPEVKNGSGSGFTIKRNGTSLEGLTVESRGSNYLSIYFSAMEMSLKQGDTVTVSYDGTSGSFVGKIKGFTLTATYNSGI